MTKPRFLPAAALLLTMATLAIAGCSGGSATDSTNAAGSGTPAAAASPTSSATGSYQAIT
jgi:hypothetical protein